MASGDDEVENERDDGGSRRLTKTSLIIPQTEAGLKHDWDEA